MAITLDGTNGIGVGATPSDAKIEAREDSSTSYPTLLKLTNGQNYGYGARMEFAQPLTNGGGIVTSAQIDSGYDGTGKGNLNFRTVDNGSSLQAMSIDSAGRVTIPYQPAFRAYASAEYTADGDLVGSSGGWVEQFDRGNNFSNGIFTAPVAGVYLVTVMWDAREVLSRIDLQKNGSSFVRYEPTGTTNSWETHSYTTNIYLSTNDYINLYGGGASGTNPFHMGSGHWGHFSATLIG